MITTSKSTDRGSRQILGVISEHKADELLTELANLTDVALTEGAKVAADLVKRYSDAFAFIPVGLDPNEVLWRFRYYLRQAWTADQRSRDWYLLRAREVEARYRAAAAIDVQDSSRRNVAIERLLDNVPAASPLEAALFHLQQIGHKTRRCLNPECGSPYFIVQKKGQRYCSFGCAQPSRQESKRRWWRENRGR
jgi:hypothetical protein